MLKRLWDFLCMLHMLVSLNAQFIILWWADIQLFTCAPCRTFGHAPGAIHCIKALEACTVSEFSPFQHNCSWVAVTGLTSKTLWFLAVEQCFGAAVCLCDWWEPPEILTSHSRLQCHLVEPKSTPVAALELLPRAVYMSQWKANGGQSVCVCVFVIEVFLCVS